MKMEHYFNYILKKKTHKSYFKLKDILLAFNMLFVYITPKWEALTHITIYETKPPNEDNKKVISFCVLFFLQYLNIAAHGLSLQNLQIRGY